MIEHLNNSRSYRKLTRNPFHRISKSKAINKSILDDEKKKKMAIKSHLVLGIYSLPKIHKDGAPLRSTINTFGGSTYNLAKHLTCNHKPFVGKTNSFIKDSTIFVKMTKGIKVKPDDLLL